MSAHTPGPWYVGNITFADVPSHDGSRKGRLAASVHNSENRFTMIRVGARSDDQDEVSANAHLVAAAPEVLEALKKLTTEMIGIAGFAPEIRALVGNTNWAVLGQRVQEAHAVIARAEGRHP